MPPAGKYIDKKCPFTGNVSIRGRIMTGVVKSTKMNRTIIVKRCGRAGPPGHGDGRGSWGAARAASVG